jgi:hypothetical protein
MAELNFNLLRQSGPANFYEGLMQGQEEQRVNALTQQKMAQNQQKMAQEQEMNALRMQQVRGAISQQERQVKTQNAAQKTAMFRERLLRAPNPNAVRDLVKMQYADPDLGPILSQTGTLEQALAEVPDDPVQFERHRQQEALGMSEWMKSQMPKVAGNRVFDPRTRSFIEPPERTASPPEIATMRELGYPQTPEGYIAFVNAKKPSNLRTPEEEAQSIRIALASRPPPPSRGDGSGSPMGKAPSGYRYTPTGDLEPIPGGPSAAGLTAKEIQKREEVLPQTTQSLKTVNNTMSIIGQTVDRLLANPDGINGITGLVFGVTPAVTDKARLAKADLEQLKNLAFIQGLTELRAASKTGAGVGNVSNREGDRFENLKASLDRSQSKDDLEAALRRLKAQSEFTIQTMQEAFDETYSYKAAAPVAPQGTGGFKYLGKEGK